MREENNGHAFAYGVKFCITEDEQRKTLESILGGSELKLANVPTGKVKSPPTEMRPRPRTGMERIHSLKFCASLETTSILSVDQRANARLQPGELLGS